MSELLEAINDYHKNHGHYPKVKVSPEYYEERPLAIGNLAENLIEIEIDETVDQWQLE